MQHKDEELLKLLVTFIDDYKDTHSGNTPSVREMADALGSSKSTVGRYIQRLRDDGEINYAGHRNIATRKSRMESETVRVPLIGEIACGLPCLAEENIEEYYRFPSALLGSGNYFALRAKGDSMTGAGIDDGDLVLVRQQETADYNQIVVALVGNEATLKRFRPSDGIIRLHAENPKYPDILLESCLVQGVAVRVVKDLA